MKSQANAHNSSSHLSSHLSSEHEQSRSMNTGSMTTEATTERNAQVSYEADQILLSTRDLLRKKKESIRKIEEQSDINAELTEKENQQMNREISEIVLRADGKLRCLFNPTDPIYQLSEETKDMPNDQEKQ